MKFEHGKSYPIDTLPDDLHSESIPLRDKWAIRDALFWNDCQGWWVEHVSDERRAFDFGTSCARFWSPLPPSPMSRQEILTERNMVVCEHCDYAITIGESHNCKGPSENLIKQRALQAAVDGRA